MSEQMKAMVYERYGNADDVLALREVDIPQVKDDEVLVRIHAASVNPLDWHLMTGTPMIARAQMGWFRPKRRIPGADIAGTVKEVGSRVSRFRPGDAVFGESNGGGHAEYAAVPESHLVHKPANVEFEEAGSVAVAAFTALQGLRDWGGMRSGDEVLINGASGGVGTFAVQIAKALGARVTGVCNTGNVETARSLGADDVIDYTREDFTKTDKTFDLFFDVAGNWSLPTCRRLLKPKGTYVAVGGRKGRWIRPLPRTVLMSLFSRMIGRG